LSFALFFSGGEEREEKRGGEERAEKREAESPRGEEQGSKRREYCCWMCVRFSLSLLSLLFCLFVWFVYLFVCLFVCLFVFFCLFVCLFMFVCCLFVCLFVCFSDVLQVQVLHPFSYGKIFGFFILSLMWVRFLPTPCGY